jgi:monofunctional biosynthetic peptidoglycan transglycosylase
VRFIPSKSWFRKCFFRLGKVFLWLIFTVLVGVIILKWVPVLFTPTMFFRSMEAYFAGKDTKIHYEWVSYAQIADDMKLAVVASEDQRFPQHTGIDFAAIQVAVEENKTRTKMGYSARGASTISQQVAKNVFLWQGGGYFRKALEVPLTYLIEVIWGKQRILEVYLNIAELGPQTFGVKAASKRFFHKKPSQLTPIEAATLAAVLPNPNIYLAQYPNGAVIYKRNHILYQMRLLGGFAYLKGLRSF